ncbi:MAG: ABC transporter ATP-binding protein [Cellulosilyticaceae bacterium]
MADKNLIKHYFVKHKWAYLAGMILVFIVDYIQMFIPEITGNVTDGIKDGSMTAEGIMIQIVFLMLTALGLVLGRIGWRYYLVGTSRKIETDIRSNLFKKWVTLDLTYFNQHKTGNLMAYATNDLNAIRMMMGTGLIILFDAIVLTLMVILRMATHVDVKLTLWAILPMPIISLGGWYLGGKVKARFLHKQKAFAVLSDKVQESFSGIKVIKAFAQEYYDIKEFDTISNDNYEKNLSLAKISAIMAPATIFLVGMSLLISIGYGGYLTMINQITIGQFVAFNQYILMLSWPMQAIAMGINVFAQGTASIKRIEDVLAEEPTVKDPKHPVVMKKGNGAIRLQNLTFNYPDNGQVGLDGINLELEAGQTLAVLGRTGSGKSTLVSLLLRLYNVPKGSIFLDGQDIMKASLESVREQIAYVPQDHFLFSDTIANNIRFGETSAKLGQVEQAAKDAHVHQNIVDFPDQYETVVGERGTMLSGGQKQRISIARAMILEAPILILDDSLSAVDTQTEETILRNLKETRGDKTNIIIAHRISTVQQADQIVVLDHGRIVERGNHESLLAADGIYAEMFRQQKLEEEINNA